MLSGSPITVSPTTRELSAFGPVDVEITSANEVYYTLNGTDPVIGGEFTYSLSGNGTIQIPEDHTLLSVLTTDMSGNFIDVERYQYDTEVEIVLHPQKEVYEIGDVISATLNLALSGNEDMIQTYQSYRWNNEQVENRFDAAEDDDRFNGPRPIFKLNKVGIFRVRCYFRDYDFQSRRVDKLFEVYPTLNVKYKGLKTDVGRLVEAPRVTQQDSSIPFLGAISKDVKDVDFAGDNPIPPGGLSI